jgi:hypothetical protein
VLLHQGIDGPEDKGVVVKVPAFDNVAIRIANAATRLAVLVLGLRYELGSSFSPWLTARLNIGNADIHEAAA